MKNKLLRWPSATGVTLLLVAIYFVYILGYHVTHPGKNEATYEIVDTADTNYDTPNDSLPAYIYKRLYKPIEDSISQAKQTQELLDKGFYMHYNGIFGLGIAQYDEDQNERFYTIPILETKKNDYLALIPIVNNKDSIASLIKMVDNIKDSIHKIKGKHTPDVKYFIAVFPFSLPTIENMYDGSFFVSNKKFYIKYPHLDSFKNNFHKGHFVYKEVPVRYIKANQYLLIPTTKFWYQFVNCLFYILFLVTISGLLYFVLILPITCLLSIAKGNPFSVENIARLFGISYFFIGLVSAQILLPCIGYLIFHKLIPTEFSLDMWKCVADSEPLIIAGIIVFIIAKAFQKGHELQKEQALTI
ncbi:DUF2975 domain-containing protein [Parasediminibacterium sp. JCM 36343]|uniref:DUF2975 domain-containing protein n=1 Tax=Parasediminibacterium sp. JCM 36343 TaxID=3374279 RepID=UPI00397BC97C